MNGNPATPQRTYRLELTALEADTVRQSLEAVRDRLAQQRDKEPDPERKGRLARAHRHSAALCDKISAQLLAQGAGGPPTP